MEFSQITTQSGEANSLALATKYVESPLALFESLTKKSAHALLLESAEINSKHNLKSLMLLDAAVVFECQGQSVTVKAHNSNGQAVLDHLVQHFNGEDQVDIKPSAEKDLICVCFPEPNINTDEHTRLKQRNAFEALRACIQTIRHERSDEYALFLGGVFAYDMLANFESLPDVPEGPNTCPDYVFYLAETLVVIDHQKQNSQIIGNVFGGVDAYANCFAVGKRLEQIKKQIDNTEIKPKTTAIALEQKSKTAQPNVDRSDSEFAQTVTQLKRHIVQGDVFQVVPSRCFSLPCKRPLEAYRHLKRDNPSPYMFYLVHPEFTLFGASPESALKFDSESRQVEVYPIAGTRKRGFDAHGRLDLDLDSRIELELRNDDKEVAEHMMLVDLARNDVARISQAGTRCVKELLQVDRYSYVMHLVSRVVGTLKPDLDALHAYQACMNMGTLVGAPKLSAARLIRQVEQHRRGSYGGAVGYLNGRGDMDTCIVIRSAFVKDNTAYIQAGAGVVHDSDPKSEADETFNKAQAVIRAVTRADLPCHSEAPTQTGNIK